MSERLKPLPAVYNHCCEVYKAMNAVATESEEGHLLYKGALTKLFAKLGLSVPYYTAVMTRLQEMDCVRQISRGGGGQPSRWLLLREPTEDLFLSMSGHVAKSKPASMQEQQLRDIVEWLKRHDQAIEMLEAKVG